MSDEVFGWYMVALGAAGMCAMIGVVVWCVAGVMGAPVFQGIGLLAIVLGLAGMWSIKEHARRYDR